MNYERQGLLLPEPSESPRDAATHDSLQALNAGTQETYKDLTLAKERQAYVAERWHRGQDASLIAEQLDETQLSERIAHAKQWKRELLVDDSLDADLKQAYRWKVNEQIANVEMLRASARGDMRNFRRWNEFINGAPDEDIYRAALDWVGHDADTLLADETKPASVHAAAARVAELLDGERGYRELIAPDTADFEAVRRDHMRAGGYYALLLDGVTIPQEGKIATAEGDRILEHVVHRNLQSDYDITDAAGSTWGVAHSKSAVERPKSYNMPWQRFVGLGAGHEIGSHLLEKVNGERGPVALAASGLDRTELGNEGRAVIREQVVYDTFDEFGKLVRWRDILRRHIAISYGYGVGAEAPRASHEVYELVNAIDTMYQTKLTPDDEVAIRTKSQAKTDALLLRVLKGTDGTGGAYLKDKVYLEGHVASWLTAAMRGPQAIADGDLGKFDINNPRHIALLQARGLLPVESTES